MTVEQFNFLERIDQAIIVAMEAELIGEKSEALYALSLYKLHHYYVEVSVEKANHINTVYRALHATPGWFTSNL